MILKNKLDLRAHMPTPRGSCEISLRYITHNVPYLFVAIPVGFSMVKRSVDNCNFFKVNQEEYTSPMHN